MVVAGKASTGEKEKEKTALDVFYDNRFTRKFCNHFMQQEGSDRCRGCQYLEKEHLKIDDVRFWARNAGNWREELHINTIEKRSVGKINFCDQVENFEKLADMAIVSNDSHPTLILNILLQEWKLSKPNLVVSVAGSTKGLSITTQQFNRVKQGLQRAVTSTESWVITGGTSLGVDGLVGEALKDAQVLSWIGTCPSNFHLIGMTNWNSIEENAAVSQHMDSDSSKPYTYMVRQRKKAAKAGMKKSMFPLNPIYSHFTNIEGGVRGKWGQEIKVRCTTEQFIGRSANASEKIPGLGIPIVLIVLGGDFDTFERCANALTNQIPVLLCQGTGGACDILCSALQLAENKNLNEDAEYQVMLAMENLLSLPKEKGKLFTRDGFEAPKHMHFVKEVIRMSESVTLFRLDRAASTTMDLDDCILKALLQSKTAEDRDPIELALKWNRCDEVVKNILLSGGDVNSRPNINNLMTAAIKNDQVDFVELFLDCGMEMATFLTPEKLMEFYELTANTHPPFLKLLKRATGKSKEKYHLKDVYQICYQFTSAKPLMKVFQVPEKKIRAFEDPFKELFLWAIFSNRMKASEFFWMLTKQPLMLALIGSRLWRAHSNALSIEDNDLEDEMEENQQKYVDFAQAMLNTCWDVNPDLAQRLVELEFSTFGNKSLMDVAGFIETKDFIAHPCVQVSIENMWKGGLRCKISQIFVSLFLPFNIAKLKLNERYETGFTCDWNDDSALRPFSKDDAAPEKQVAEVGKDEEGEQQEDPEEAYKKTFKYKAELYYRAPVTKFISHTLAYIVFLIIFTQFYVYDNDEGPWSKWEYINFMFMFSYIMEEIRQIVMEDATMGMKLKIWAQSEWNMVDAFYLSQGMLAFILKPINGYCFATAKGFYGIVLMLMWIRLLRFYQCSPKLGPMWIMIRKMLAETLIFMMLLLVILIGFGVSQKVLMNIYGVEDPYSDGYQWLILRPFFMFNGELFLDSVEGNDPASGVIVPFVVLQLFFGNALMLNLLIAIYGEIFSTVLEISDVEWKNEMFALMKEYQDKTFLPPPLALFETFFYILQHCCSRGDSEDDEGVTKQLYIFETYCLNRVVAERLAEKSTDDLIKEIDKDILLQNDRVKDTHNILENIRKGLQRRQEQKEEKERNRWMHKQEGPQASLFDKSKPSTPTSPQAKPAVVEEDSSSSESGEEFEEEPMAEDNKMMLFSERKL